MELGDIWLASLDPAFGREQQGQRPLIIVSRREFNLYGTPIVLPITSGGNFARTTGLVVSLMGTGMRTTGIVRCDQPRALDLQKRGGKRIERAPDYIVDEVLARFMSIFE
jgi:mRNA-degrading endonuclease toxin of MazEF toxin-antitoxin module